MTQFAGEMHSIICVERDVCWPVCSWFEQNWSIFFAYPVVRPVRGYISTMQYHHKVATALRLTGINRRHWADGQTDRWTCAILMRLPLWRVARVA